MNSKNSKTSDTHRLLLNLRGKINLNKVSTPTWNEELQLPDESYSIQDIQDYFGYILKKTWRKES